MDNDKTDLPFAVIFAKEVFGGTGYNIFNVALVTRAFLFFAYPDGDYIGKYYKVKIGESSFFKMWNVINDTSNIESEEDVDVTNFDLCYIYEYMYRENYSSCPFSTTLSSMILFTLSL